MSRAAKKTSAEPRPAIGERGEDELELGGNTYLLRPTFAARIAIERQTRAIGQLAKDASALALPIEDATIAVVELINAGAEGNPMRKVSVERVGPMIHEAAYPVVCGLLAKLFVEALTGGRTAEGEARAPEGAA